VNLINNTIASNDTTASSGTLFNTLGAPLASSQSPPPTITTNGTNTLPQPAGFVTLVNSPQLTSSFTTGTITCPTGHYAPGTSAANGTCIKISYPALNNNIIWQNRAFNIGVGALSTQYQQNVVSLFNAFSGTPAATQPQGDATTANGNGVIITGGTGACTPGASYWDIGVRGDTGPTNHASGFTLAPMYSVLTDATDYPGLHNLASDPTVVSQYCNGSRVPPENGGLGYQVPPGISDATAPNPLFSLTPNATVDEGNNWVNIGWGPLSMVNPVTNTQLSNYALAAGSPAIDYVPAAGNYPTTDFFGNPRPDTANTRSFDVGAVENQNTGRTVPTLTSIAPNSGLRGAIVTVTLTGTSLSSITAVNTPPNIIVTSFTAVSSTTVSATLDITAATTLGNKNISVTTLDGTSNTVVFTVTVPPPPTLTSIGTGSGVRGTSVNVTLNGTNLTGATWSNATTTGYPNITFGTLTVNATGTSATATLTIAANASLGVKNLSVTTPNGTSNTVPFTVTGATVAFSGSTPALNTGGTSTKTGTITVSNAAAATASFTFTATPTLAQTGTGNGTYAITAGGTCNSGAVVNPGSSCTVNVQYSGETNTATANGRVTITGTGLATATLTSANIPAN
jgi:hypothetical protein